MKLIVLIILFTSSFCQAEDLSVVLKACKKQKETNFCQNVLRLEKNAAQIGEALVQDYNLEAPLAVGVFLSDPKYVYSQKNHNVTFKPQSVTYSYSVEF